MKYRSIIILATLFIGWTSAALSIDWRELDPFDPESAVGKGIRSLNPSNAGEWGYQVFPILADEIHQKNVVRQKKKIVRLTSYQLKWLDPWLTRWKLDAADIGIVYDAALLNNYKIFGRWPITLMDEYEGQTFGNIIYIRQPYRQKDGGLLVLLCHEAFHVRQYRQTGSIAEFGRNYVAGFVEAFFSYRDNPMEKEAYQAEAEFRNWLCAQEGWRCE